MILRITYLRNRGGGTAAARILAKFPSTAGTLLFLESDEAEMFRSGLSDKEHSAHFLDFAVSQRLVKHMLKEHDQVLLHSHGRRAGLHARLCRLRFGKRVKVVHSFHGIASFAGVKKYISALSESALSVVTDAVIADGNAELELFKFFPPLFCPSVLIMPAYNPENVICHSFRSIRRIGFAARMAYPKLHDLLIRLVAAFNERHADRALTLVFSGDGPKRAEVDALGKRMLDSHYVSLGHIPSICALYDQIDAYAHFSLFEGLGISIVEAMVSGLPCIATDVIGCRDVINSPEIGMLLPLPDKCKQLAMLEQLVYDEATARKFSEKGRLSALERFAPEPYAAAHAGLYAQIGYRNFG